MIGVLMTSNAAGIDQLDCRLCSMSVPFVIIAFTSRAWRANARV